MSAIKKEKICSVDDCHSKVLARGFCSKHYQRLVIFGTISRDSTKGRPRKLSDEERAERMKAAQKKRDKGRYARWSDEQRSNHHKSNAKYRSTVPEKTVEWQRKASATYRASNPLSDEQKLERSVYMKEWYQLNGRAPDRLEKSQKRSSIWYRENIEKRSIARAAWIKANPEKGRLYAQNRRQRKINNGTGLSTNIVGELMLLQKGKCIACLKNLSVTGYEIDHIHPLFRGGKHADSNVQLLCPSCNRIKGTKEPSMFMQSMGFLL